MVAMVLHLELVRDPRVQFVVSGVREPELKVTGESTKELLKKQVLVYRRQILEAIRVFP
jgi:hypothetical protein